ncbi:hypothetical protein AAHH78_35740, partial [Burkholderia pseudomallei]
MRFVRWSDCSRLRLEVGVRFLVGLVDWGDFVVVVVYMFLLVFLVLPFRLFWFPLCLRIFVDEVFIITTGLLIIVTVLYGD